MKRTVLVIAAVVSLFAASSRDEYRAAYRAWRQADPNLERDAAATAGTALAARVQSVAGEAAKYGAQRAGFLRQAAADPGQGLAPVEMPGIELGDFGRPVRENVDAETAVVKRNLDTFANDPDPAIQRLKAMLDRENGALASLSNAVAERQSAADAAKSAGGALEQARSRVLKADGDLAGAVKSAAGEADRETAAWAEYYRKLADAARVEPPRAPAPTVAAPSNPQVSFARYTGAWTFPNAGLFHGPQPEFVDLVVHGENGHATGTLFARFKVAAGSKEDPVLRFDFSGDFKNTRTQTFTLETSDGAKGTIELIPGPAFNLLEVNFQTEVKPGKIAQGNVVLVKK
jgi:hypothetical protein